MESYIGPCSLPFISVLNTYINVTKFEKSSSLGFELPFEPYFMVFADPGMFSFEFVYFEV